MEENDGFVVEVYEMKKILVLSLCFVLALWMAGCVQNKNINFGDVTMKVVEGSVTPSGLTVRISNNTGSLSAGEYRVVKFFYPSTEDGSYGTDDGFYLFAEFSIE